MRAGYTVEISPTSDATYILTAFEKAVSSEVDNPALTDNAAYGSDNLQDADAVDHEDNAEADEAASGDDEPY